MTFNNLKLVKKIPNPCKPYFKSNNHELTEKNEIRIMSMVTRNVTVKYKRSDITDVTHLNCPKHKDLTLSSELQRGYLYIIVLRRYGISPWGLKNISKVGTVS